MFINSLASAGIANSVWTNATRQLSSLSANVMTVLSQAQTTLAASASLDLRPTVNKQRELTFAFAAGAAGSTEVDLYDGTHAIAIGSAAAGAQAGFTLYGNSVAGPRIHNNDGTNATTYMYGGIDLIQ